MWCIMLTCSFCRFIQAALEPTSGRNGTAFLNAACRREAFYRQGVRMWQNLIMTDVLSSACWEQKKREKLPVDFFPRAGVACWLCHEGFSWLLGIIKG
jgi:hypothetical protein